MMMQIKRFVKEGNSSENAEASRRKHFPSKMYTQMNGDYNFLFVTNYCHRFSSA